MRRLLPFCGLALPLFLGGCQPVENALNGLRENETLHNAARGVLIGKAYDRAAIAQRNQDIKAKLALDAELNRLDPQIVDGYRLQAAERLVRAGTYFYMLSEELKEGAPKSDLEVLSSQKYREALQISPDFPSKNPNLLNALGYFLAEKGSGEKDFQKAELLLRESLKRWDEVIKKASKSDITLLRFARAHGTQDSLAWALFRQKRFEEALKEQQQAIRVAEETAPQVNEKIAADLYFHLAEIERGLGRLESARANYQAALQREPDHKPSLDALRILDPLKSPPSSEPVPQPEGVSSQSNLSA